MKLTEIGEFGLIGRIRSDLENFQKGAIIGIGDDTAAIEISSEDLLLFTTDTLVEDVHFKWNYTSPFQVGQKALAVNVSDIAAVGGRPTYCLVSLGLPQDTEASLVDDLYKGLKETASLYKVGIIGGDLVRSPVSIITVSLLGRVKKKRIILRSGAKKADLICVTGKLGGAAAGLACLKRADLKLNQSAREFLIKRHLMPSPRLVEAQEIARKNLATAMIDLSDGLVSDLTRLTKESGVGAILWEDKIPVASSTRDLARELGKSPLEWALYGGEDYELLFTVSPHKKEKIEKNLDFSFALIGEIVDKREGICLMDKTGTRTRIEGRGYDHFSV